MHRKTRLKVTDLNPLLTCSLCKGYLIDATTLNECLHSFCRSCLVRYLYTSTHCPICDTLIHKTRPLLNARVDRTLQNIVYKLTPGLFKDEMQKRRDFYAEHPSTSNSSVYPTILENRGEVNDEAIVIYSDDEYMNLSLEYYLPHRRKYSDWSTIETENGQKGSSSADEEVICEEQKESVNEDDKDEYIVLDKRYLRCPAAVCVKHIKKFIKNKFDMKPHLEIELTHIDNEDDPLPDDYTLMDIAYIYAWRRNGPLPLVFRVLQKSINRHKETPVSNAMITTIDIHLQKYPLSMDTVVQPPHLHKEPNMLKRETPLSYSIIDPNDGEMVMVEFHDGHINGIGNTIHSQEDHTFKKYDTDNIKNDSMFQCEFNIDKTTADEDIFQRNNNTPDLMIENGDFVKDLYEKDTLLDNPPILTPIITRCSTP